MDADQSTNRVTELFDSSYSLFVRYAIRATGSLDSAEDLVQEAFMLLYKELSNGKHVDNPKAWTFCVIRRLLSKQIRTHPLTTALPPPSSALTNLTPHAIS